MKNSFMMMIPLALFVFLHHSPLLATATYSVVNYGARGDGKTDASRAFLAAWNAACASTSPAQVYFPPGRYFLGRSLSFKGINCKNTATVIRIDGTLVAPSDYRVLGNAGYWLHFQDVTGVSIYGGALDGQGSALWACKASGGGCPLGATSLQFTNSNSITINGLRSINSQMFHIVIDGCHNVKIQQVRVTAAGDSPNTDGIHVQMSTGVSITGSVIGTGDDCVSVGPGTTNLWIENIGCGPGHGISIGSLGKGMVEPGVRNVTVKTATFKGTQNGVRIKSWARPSNGFVSGVRFQHITMDQVQNPIIIDQNYCPDNKNCPDQFSGVKITDVAYEDIHGTSATKVAVKFDCSPKNPCSGLKMEDVKLTYQNTAAAAAACTHAIGTADGLVVPSSCL